MKRRSRKVWMEKKKKKQTRRNKLALTIQLQTPAKWDLESLSTGDELLQQGLNGK